MDTYALAKEMASTQSNVPRAMALAMLEDSVQPVPCVCGVSYRADRNHTPLAPSHNRGSAFSRNEERDGDDKK
jgi:hypothetical protein